jgi:hypothetical protein
MNVKTFIILAFNAGLLGSGFLASQAAEAPKVSPSIAQVVKLHESGVSAEVLLAYVKETPISKPNADEVLYLTEKAIPKEVVVAMLSKRVWADMPAAQSQPAPAQAQTQSQLPPAVTTRQPATQTVVYVQQPTPAVTYVGAPAYYPGYYYRPWYYDPWPAFSIGFGFGHAWHHGHWGHHHHGGIHVHRR